LPLLAHAVTSTIASCGALLSALAAHVNLPRELAPGYRVYMRGPHTEALLWMEYVSTGGSPWSCDRKAWRDRRVQAIAYALGEGKEGTKWGDGVSNWVQAESLLGASR